MILFARTDTKHAMDRQVSAWRCVASAGSLAKPEVDP
jgi:hypothetical protein